MSITLRGIAANPGDNTSLYDSVERSIIPVPAMVTGDLVYLFVSRKSLATITQSNLGGQTWNAGTLRQGGSFSSRVFWCRFNGTWSANPSIVSQGDGTIVISLYMEVWIPSVGTNTWAVDVAESFHTYSAPVSPFDVSIASRNSIAASTVTIASWLSVDVNTWGVQTAGWTQAGAAQYRNPDPSHTKPISISTTSKALTVAGATGTVVNRQLTLGGDAGLNLITTFKEQSAGVTISAAGDGVFHNGETGISITGTAFGASHTGSADIILSPTDNIADAGAVVQTQTAWADTTVTFTAVLGSFTPFTNLFLFVKSSAGASNSSGFVIQREMWASVTAVLKNLAGATQNNLTNVIYSMRAVSPRGTELVGNTNGTTDGSGNFTVPTYVLTSGGPLNNGDDVWVTAAVNGVSQALSFATQVKVTPTYT